MTRLEWLFRTRGDTEVRDRVLAAVPALFCEHLNLCASVGCPCTTGMPGTDLCEEGHVAGVHPVHTSNGPTWAIVSTALPDAVLVDAFFEGPLVGEEVRALDAALLALEVPFSHITHAAAY